MIHPNTELRQIDPIMGYGVFATSFIPEGTIVYIKDALEIELSEKDYLKLDKRLKPVVDKYCYTDENGVKIISWDHAKYVNHCCQCNTLSTGYGFEIAIKDIFPFEQITDDYGLLNIESDMPLSCEKSPCRKTVKPLDIDQYYSEWDDKVKKSLCHFSHVEQPLSVFIEEKTRENLEFYLKYGNRYRSVKELRLNKKLV